MPVRVPSRYRKYDSKLEEKFAELLDLRLHAGEIKYWWYAPMNLRLTKVTFYRPDFLVLTNDNELIIYETKGFMRDDANVKIKVAANLYPFRFILVQKIKGQWIETEIDGGFKR